MFVTSVPSFSEAADKTSQKNFFITVKYNVNNMLVSFPITIRSHYITYYTLTTTGGVVRFNITPQRQGGTIVNGTKPNYYPFGQTIYDAKVKHYRDGSLYTTWSDFSWDTSDVIYEPDNWPWGYVCTSTKYLYDNYDNRLNPSVVWMGNGTLPATWTLNGNPIYF